MRPMNPEHGRYPFHQPLIPVAYQQDLKRSSIDTYIQIELS
jgi:hypothetical protein